MIKKFLYSGYKIVSSPRLRILTITLIYYSSLYFSVNNRSFLLLTLIYWFVLIKVVKNFYLSTFLVFLVTLPFPKGKAYEILLLSKENIPRWTLYDIKYFFPIYLSDFFLAILVYSYIRKLLFVGKLDSSKLKSAAKEIISKNYKVAITLFFLFTFWVLVNSVRSTFPEVGILSSIQLLRMFVILGIPIILTFLTNKRLGVVGIHAILSVVIGLLIFESGWTLLQRLNNGPLGKDIEVYLPGASFGIFSSENRDLLRNNGTFFEPSILGTFLLMHIAILLAIILQRRLFDKLRTPAIIAVSGGSIALIFTGSRVLYTVLIGLFVTFLILYKKINPLNLAQFKKSFSLKYVLGFILILFFTLPYLINRLGSLIDVFSQYGSATYRIQMIFYSLRIFFENPLTGAGINLSPYLLASGFSGERFAFDPTYPHNLTVQLLAEMGLVGTLIFILFTLSVLRPIFSKIKDKITPGFAAAAGVYFFCAQFYPIFLNHTELSSFFFLYAGLSFIKFNHD